eukprot:CAMPEP_0174229024 /NCGR_PEP_ID=MMETSP0417-20130205/92_1 /TAXON_ID=242541 /ORGANISM="Mayorella sp, Strain BSH-02190019" /LENGTH=339 /DNA_ID=CAMNT_0015306521 /DNA_START=53 /DNA_END=1072 /DNA_ORIENTATION=+
MVQAFFEYDQAPVSLEQLLELGLLYFHVDLDQHAEWETHPDLCRIRKERSYVSSDVVDLKRETVPKEKLASFFEEHLHDDEEIRFVLEGSGYFDVRDAENRWIRIQVVRNDLLVLPAGIYHRFALDDKGAIKVVRLFQEEPKWTAYNRVLPETDSRSARQAYVKQVLGPHCSAPSSSSSSSSSSSTQVPAAVAAASSARNGIAYVIGDRAKSLAHYPHMRSVNGFLYVSGCSSRRADNTHIGAEQDPVSGEWKLDIVAQTEAVIKNIEAILAEAGATLADLVDLTVFLVDMKDYKGMNEAYNKYFDQDTGPTRTTVAVHQLPHPNLLIEIKAVAVAPSQ